MSLNKLFVGIIVFGSIGFIVLLAVSPKNETPIPRAATSAPAKTPGPDMRIVSPDRKIDVTVSEREGVELVNELFAAVDPSNPENNYMTPFMKEKIGWVYGEIASKRLVFTPSAYFGKNADGTTNDTMLMNTSYIEQNGQTLPTITLLVPRLLTLVKAQHGLSRGFNDAIKNTFALTLVHEAVHLEKGTEYFLKKHNAEEVVEEESRAWAKVNLQAVRALRKDSQPLEPDFLEIDDLLHKCRDDYRCTEFKHLISGSFSNKPIA